MAGSLLADISAAARRATAMQQQPASLRIEWTQDAEFRLFTAVNCEGTLLVRFDSPGLLDGFCRLAGEDVTQKTRLSPKQPTAVHGPVRLKLQHQIRRSGHDQNEDLLEAKLTLVNTSRKSQTAIVGFETSAQPTPDWAKQNIFIPLSATCGHPAIGDLRNAAHKQADYAVGQRAFTAHYLEPLASDLYVRTPIAPLLAPVWTSTMLTRSIASV